MAQMKPPLDILLTIRGIPIFARSDGTYVYFRSDLDVCNDGSGPSHGDPSYQSQTAYYNGGKYLNADKDQYIVIPGQIRSMVVPIVMGCQARLTNLIIKKSFLAVVGDIGPSTKTGEAAYCLAKKANHKITHNRGDSTTNYLYELWPGTPAFVDGKSYELEAAGG
jgi:hypothetical protein